MKFATQISPLLNCMLLYYRCKRLTYVLNLLNNYISFRSFKDSQQRQTKSRMLFSCCISWHFKFCTLTYTSGDNLIKITTVKIHLPIRNQCEGFFLGILNFSTDKIFCKLTLRILIYYLNLGVLCASIIEVQFIRT